MIESTPCWSELISLSMYIKRIRFDVWSGSFLWLCVLWGQVGGGFLPGRDMKNQVTLWNLRSWLWAHGLTNLWCSSLCNWNLGTWPPTNGPVNGILENWCVILGNVLIDFFGSWKHHQISVCQVRIVTHEKIPRRLFGSPGAHIQETWVLILL